MSLNQNYKKLPKVLLLLSLSLSLSHCSSFKNNELEGRIPSSKDYTIDELRENDNEVLLENCGGREPGRIKLIRADGGLNLLISGINTKECSRWSSSRSNFQDDYPIKANESTFKIPVNEDNPGERLILFSSVAFLNEIKTGKRFDEVVSDGKHGDMVKFRIQAKAKDTTPDYITLNGLPAVLENCGGSDGRVRLITDRTFGLSLQVDNVECAFWASSRDNFAKVHHVERASSGSRSYLIPIDDSITGQRTIHIGSKNYFDTKGKSGNADVIKFYVPSPIIKLDVRSDSRASSALKNCGGDVEAVVKDGKINIIFRNVRNCDNMKFIRANNEKLSDDFDLSKQGKAFGGSFTVKKKYIEYGQNSILLSVFKKDGTEDKIQINALGFNWLSFILDVLN